METKHLPFAHADEPVSRLTGLTQRRPTPTG